MRSSSKVVKVLGPISFLLQENDETYDHIKESSDLANAEAIKTCPVVLEEDYNYEQGALYQQV